MATIDAPGGRLDLYLGIKYRQETMRRSGRVMRNALLCLITTAFMLVSADAYVLDPRIYRRNNFNVYSC